MSAKREVMNKKSRTRSELILRRAIGDTIHALLEKDTVSYTTSITSEQDGIPKGWELELRGERVGSPEAIQIGFYRFPYHPDDQDVLTVKWEDVRIIDNEMMADYIMTLMAQVLRDEARAKEEITNDGER